MVFPSIDGGVDAQAFGEDEALALGLSPLVPRNPAVDAMLNEDLLSGMPTRDYEGRPVMSLDQYYMVSQNDKGVNLSEFLGNQSLIYVLPDEKHPSRLQRGPVAMQASKHIKWIGKGFVPVEEWYQKQPKKEKVSPKRPEPAEDEAAKDNIQVYFCADKYSECKRFFDSQKGLDFHWRKEHGEAPIKRKKKE